MVIKFMQKRKGEQEKRRKKSNVYMLRRRIDIHQPTARTPELPLPFLWPGIQSEGVHVL